MALILTRSPYFVSRSNLDEGASLTLEIGDYDADAGGFQTDKTFVFNFRNAYYLDIAPFLNDYLGEDFTYVNGWQTNGVKDVRYCRITLSGEVSGVAQSDVVTEFHFTGGYLYSTDDYNEDKATELANNAYYAGSSDKIYKLDQSIIRIPLLRADNTLIASGATVESVDIAFLKNRELIYGTTLSFDNSDPTTAIRYISTDFVEWGSQSGGIFEETFCNSNFIENNRLLDLDEIIVTVDGGSQKVIKVETISECKYNPYKIRFKNRYGVLEDLWFFKKSVKSMSVNKERYRPNSIKKYTSGSQQGVKTQQDFNVNGMDRIVLNSGFVDEELNETFKQLMLSEEVYLIDFSDKSTESSPYNINILSSDIEFKTHVNDKLINYTIEVEFAHEVINNVG